MDSPDVLSSPRNAKDTSEVSEETLGSRPLWVSPGRRCHFLIGWPRPPVQGGRPHTPPVRGRAPGAHRAPHGQPARLPPPRLARAGAILSHHHRRPPLPRFPGLLRAEPHWTLSVRVPHGWVWNRRRVQSAAQRSPGGAPRAQNFRGSALQEKGLWHVQERLGVWAPLVKQSGCSGPGQANKT